MCRRALTEAGRDQDDVVGVRVLRLRGHSAQTGVVFLRNGTNAEQVGATISGAAIGGLEVTTSVLADASDDERLGRAVMTLVRRVQTEADSAWESMARGRRGVGEGPRLASDVPRRA
ncbi:hypothetical protein FNF27_03826 [Cafeteria roenbergensis]|nr:hypothetical protein FNF27_03826 [Cafeteria roenbergensis]